VRDERPGDHVPVVRAHGPLPALPEAGMSALPGLAPPASLLLPAPVWGIDPSTKRMAFASLTPTFEYPGTEERPIGAYPPILRWATVSLPTHPAPHVKLAAWAGRIGHFVEACRDEWGVPALVAIEQPFSTGHKTEPMSYMALAALLVALGLRVPDAEVCLIPPQTWKAKATGSGYAPGLPRDASKTARRRAEKARLMEWARAAGYAGQSEDEADACGIATAAGVILEGR
jgi:hypothetical protein